MLDLLRSARGGDDETLTDPFTQHVWVYACVKARARALSSVPLRLWVDDREDAREIESGPLYDVLRRPHPLIGAAKLWAFTSIYWDLYGEVYWLLYQRSGDGLVPFDAALGARIQTPVEIVPAPGSAITVEWDERTALPRRYWYSASRAREARTEFLPGSVVPFIDVGHQNPLRGVSGAEALRRRLEADFAAETLDMRAAQNGGMPSYWLSTPDQFSEPQLDQIESRLAARQNSPDRHNKPALLHGGLKLENVAWTPKDMENAAMRSWSRDAIMAVFGVTKPILGITDDVNRANAREAKAVFWEETIIPQQGVLATTLRDGLLSRLTEGGGRYSCSFDTSGIDALGESLDDKIARVEKLVAMGLTVNKAAELAQWEIDPLTDDDFERPEPVIVPAPPVVPADAPEDEGNGAPAQPADRDLRAPQTAQAREFAVRAVRDTMDRSEARIAAAVEPVQREYLEAVRTKLRQVEQRSFRPKRPTVRATADELPEDVLRELERMLLPNLVAWQDRFGEAVEPALKQAYLAAAADLVTFVGGPAPKTELAANDLAWLANKQIRLAEGAMSSLAKDTKLSIARVMLEQGDSFTVAQIQERLIEHMEPIEAMLDERIGNVAVRAQRIARTEAMAVTNNSRINEMFARGYTQHTWDHAPSPDERNNHAALDGRTARIGEEFAPGILWPGHTSLPAAEVVNCRCTTWPFDQDVEDILAETTE